MTATLGAGDNIAVIYDRRGESQLLPALPAASITWERTLSDISRPSVTVAPARCTPQMQDISSWAHSLVIFRDGQRMHEGPVRTVTHNDAGLTITSSDVVGWTEVRAVRAVRTGTNVKVRDELAWNLDTAFSRDDPNVLDYVRLLGAATTTTDRDLSATGAYAEDLATLVSAGGRYTALGRSIMLWDEAATIGRLATLVPEQHLSAGVTITDDGDQLITGALITDDNGGSAYYPTNGSELDPFYGLVERPISAGEGTHTLTALQGIGRAAKNVGYPTPLIIDMPSGVALQCDAPFPIEDLVPGVLVPVETTTATAKQVSATMVLSNVTVTQQAGADEKVTVTLVPVSQAVNA
jgi:hypothetical protein